MKRQLNAFTYSPAEIVWCLIVGVLFAAAFIWLVSP